MTSAGRELVGLAMALLLAMATAGCQPPQPAATGPVIVSYWSSWTGFEADAMQRVVDRFNQSQSRIFVRMTTGGDPQQKVVLAAAGGHPPDLVQIDGDTVSSLAEMGVLVPLDDWLARDTVDVTRFVPVYYEACRYLGHTWAVPLAPSTVAMFWNKDLFVAAGLDPDQPPTTIEALNTVADKLTARDPNGRLVRMGFLPTDKDWFADWPIFFGGKLWNGRDTMTVDSPDDIRAYTWLQSFPQRYGVADVQDFRSGFGPFGSPQNPFFTGKVAIVFQGVWMSSFIHRFKPDMHWGAAPFPYPQDRPELANTTPVFVDMLAIPHGAAHAEAAWEFARYMTGQAPLEQLCLEQGRQSPLQAQSSWFLSHHPNPALPLFIRLGESTNAQFRPHTPVWQELKREMMEACDRILLVQGTPQAALAQVQRTMQRQLDRLNQDHHRRGTP